MNGIDQVSPHAHRPHQPAGLASTWLGRSISRAPLSPFPVRSGRHKRKNASARVLHDQVFAEKEQTPNVEGDRLVRGRRVHRIRLPHCDAVEKDFLEPLGAVDWGFSHADRRDLAAAASTRKGFGIERQISAVLDNIRDSFGSDMDHVRLRIACVRCWHPGYRELRGPLGRDGCPMTVREFINAWG